MNLGENLKQARVDKGLTQEDVSKSLFVTRQTISRWEQNKTLPNVYVMEALSTLYDVPIEQLYSRKKESEPVTQTEEPMKKLNLFALFGSIFFNAFLFSGVAITMVTLILSYWLTVGLFIVSPFTLLYVNISGMQAFSWLNTIAALILCPLGLISIRLGKRITMSVYDMFIKYCKFNMKAIFVA